MLRRFSINFAIFSMACDAMLVGVSLYATAAVRPLLNSLPFIAPILNPAPIPPLLFILFPLLWVSISATFSIYDGKKFIRVVDEFSALSLVALLAVISMAGILYLSFRDVSRAQFFVFVLATYTALLSWRTVARLVFRLRRLGHPAADHRVLIVGTGPIGRMVEARLRGNADLDLALVGHVDNEPAGTFSGRWLGPIEDLRRLVSEMQITDVIIALPPHFYDQMRESASALSDVAVRVWIALGFFDLALYTAAMEDFAGLPMLDLRASALDDYERILKRSFDLVFGLLTLLVAFPVMLITGLLIWLSDRGPVFFRQNRVGENGRLFLMYKFRTMVPEAESLRQQVEKRDEHGNLIHKSKDDPRVTPLGRVLRRFSIDELPQLFNVLKGDMSLVGPRPELPHLVEQYQSWQRQRLAVPPGITGWWQITGRSDKTMHLHAEDDLYYVNNYSIWLDLQIIVRTLWVVVLGRGAY